MIYINNKLRISKVDDNCLQIEVNKETVSKKTKEKTMKWQWAGYYGDLKSAFIGILKKKLFSLMEEELALKDIIDRIDKSEKNILQAIKDNATNPMANRIEVKE